MRDKGIAAKIRAEVHMLTPIVGLGQGFIASTVKQSTPHSAAVVSEKDWIGKAFKSIKKRGTEGVCTGDKFGSSSCPPGSKRYNMAKNLRSISRKGKS